MTYERRGVTVIQELINQTVLLNTPDLAALIIGPCYQVVSDMEVLSSIPYSEEDLDISELDTGDSQVFTDLTEFTVGKNFVDAVYYDDEAGGTYFPASEFTADINLVVNSDVTLGETASIVVTGDYSAYNETNVDMLLIYDDNASEYVAIDASVFSDPDTTFTAALANSYTTAANAKVLLISTANKPAAGVDAFAEVISTDPEARTSTSIVFVHQSADTLTSLKIVVTTYPLTISYPGLKSGAEIDTESVYFTLTDAKAVVGQGFMTDIGTTDTFDSIDVTNKIVTFETGGFIVNEYALMYLELNNGTTTERRQIVSNTADTATVSIAFNETYITTDVAKIFVLQEIGDPDVNTFGEYDFTAMGVEPGDVIEFSNNGGTYAISSVNETDSSILDLATSVYHALRSDETAEAKFTIYRYYATLDLSTDVTVKDWVAQSTSVTLFSIEDNDNNRIVDGELSINYIAFRTDIANEIIQYNDTTELAAAMDIDLNNPLGQALSIALGNTATPIFGLAVASDDQTGYTTALERTEGRDDLYCLVPLSQSSVMTGLTKTNVEEQSLTVNSNFRITLITTPLQTQTSVSDGSGIIS